MSLYDGDGSTMPSTDIYEAGKTYINIGSGNVFKLRWDSMTLESDTVAYYNLVIKRYDPTLKVYYDIFDKNIGLVNEFYVNSSVLPALPEQYLLHAYVVAHGKNGGVATSNVVTPYVCKGSGTFVKVQPDSYAQPIMKRAIAFANARVSNPAMALIIDADGNEVPILDSEGNQIPVEAVRLLTNDTWQLATESSVKAADGTWKTTDIEYEVLVVKNEETDKFEPLEVLNNERTGYEQLYTL